MIQGLNHQVTSNNFSRRSFLQAGAAAALMTGLLPRSLHAEEVEYEALIKSKKTAELEKIVNYSNIIHRLDATLNLKLSTKLHPEYKLDLSPQQQAIIAQQKPLEFSQGYLYHGRGNLQEILLQGNLPQDSFLTRVPQTWALQPFVDSETNPAIFVIDALDFNRWRNKGQANLLVNTGPLPTGLYDSDPYPSLIKEFPVDSILQIITTKESIQSFRDLVKKYQSNPSGLSEEEKQFAEKLIPLLDEGKITSFTINSSLKNLTKEQRLLELNDNLTSYMKIYQMDKYMPTFRIQTANSTKINAVTPKPLNTLEALGETFQKLSKLKEEIKTENTLKQQKIESQARLKEKKRLRDRLTNYVLTLAGLVGVSGSVYGLKRFYRELFKALEADQTRR